VQRAHERELGLMFDESLSMRAEMDYKATTTALENQRMQGELASYIVRLFPPPRCHGRGAAARAGSERGGGR
jgi:hypothetical protein